MLLFIIPHLCSQSLLINEVVSSNLYSLSDNYGENSDWIELYNAGNEPIYLGNFYLTDDESNYRKWKLPDIYLATGDLITFYASNRFSAINSLHTNFSLSSDGEPLVLSNQYGVPVDQVLLPKLNRDISYGRVLDGSDEWGYFFNSTPESSNSNSISYSCLVEDPIIDQPSGSSPGSFQLNVSHPDNNTVIHYNLEGNDPVFSDPIAQSTIEINSDPDTIKYSGIPTNPAFNYPLPGYSETRANNRGWVPPYSKQNTISVVKVQASRNGCISSNVIARTFLIAEDHDINVLSIQTDSSGFFSDENGIYVWGNASEGNYSVEGLESERISNIDLFNKDGELIFSNQAGIRIGGNGSRQSTQKNLNVFFRGVYGDPFVTEELFENSGLDKWKRLTFRSGGHRPDCLPKDEFASALVKNLPFEHSKYKYASTYLNGEYWGIHAIKERLNKHYLEEKYNLHRDSIAFLGNEGDLLDGIAQDSIDYQEMINYVENNNLNDQAPFDSIMHLIDINNFTDYFSSEIFLGNADWPNSNIKFWKKRTRTSTTVNKGHDGKWRWVLFDLDGSFGGTCNDVYVTFNTLNWALRDDASFAKYTTLFRNLLDNEQYKTDFINRTCDLINSSFKSSVTRPKLESIKNIIDLDIDNHIDRWRYPSLANTLADRYNEVPNTQQWEYLTAQMDTFLMKRPHYVRKHMFNEWGLSDSVRLRVDVNNDTMGSVKVNSILVNKELEGVSQNIYPWTGVYFSDLKIPLEAIPKEGYKFVKWVETGITDPTITITMSGDSLFTALFEPNPDYTPLEPILINEIQSSNTSTYIDEYNQYDDWIEFYNPNDTSFNLLGYYITDDPLMPKKYQFDNSIVIPKKGHLIIWCDAENEQGLNHSSFKLNKEGDFIGLVSENGVFIDSLNFGSISTDYSYGRESDGNSEWTYFHTPTPNAPNDIIESEVVTDELILYPNPNYDGVLNANMPITGSIYSGAGSLVVNFQSTKKINLQNISQGIYYLKTNEGITRKILVAK